MFNEKRMDPITIRIEKLRKQASLSRRAFCAKINFSYARYHHLAGVRKARPSVDLLEAVVKHMGVSIEWLFTGNGALFPKKHHKKFTPIPFHGADDKTIDDRHQAQATELSKINGTPEKKDDQNEFDLVEEQFSHDKSYVALDDDWVKHELGFQPEKLVFIHVRGDAMKPTLKPCDVILLEYLPKPPYFDGIYLLSINKALLLKRLQFFPAGNIRVSSDNPEYQPFEVENNGASAIKGRLLWVSRRY